MSTICKLIDWLSTAPASCLPDDIRAAIELLINEREQLIVAQQKTIRIASDARSIIAKSKKNDFSGAEKKLLRRMIFYWGSTRKSNDGEAQMLADLFDKFDDEAIYQEE